MHSWHREKTQVPTSIPVTSHRTFVETVPEGTRNPHKSTVLSCCLTLLAGMSETMRNALTTSLGSKALRLNAVGLYSLFFIGNEKQGLVAQ